MAVTHKLDSIETLPAPLREIAERNWARVPDPPKVPGAALVMACSDFVAAAAAADPGVFAELDRPRSRAEYDAFVADLGAEPEAVLRRVRRTEAARIAWRDLAGLADLESVVNELSDLADACIQAAYRHAEAELVARFGTPRDAAGRAQRLVVVAMGKLGAHELNFSSDIDLIFAWPENGATDGERSISNEEFFNRCGRRLIQLLDAPTPDGFVYRVDMRLRPFGGAGPLALSFGAIESYYQEQGRDWERYALIKARPVTGDPDEGRRLLGLLRPFVFRRYLDYGSFEQLRRMKAKIEREVTRRELADNIKLGPGGIREVEFVGQAFQLIRGGRDPELQERRILRVLELLAASRHISVAAAAALQDAYKFLRRVENRLQALADQQVHDLPEEPLARLRLAAAMGFNDWNAFADALAAVRASVAEHFDAVFASPDQAEDGGDPVGMVWHHEDAEGAEAALSAAGFVEPEAALTRLVELRRGAYWRSIGDDGRARLEQLLPAVLRAAAAHPNPDAVLLRLLRVVEAIDRRISYLALLIENPRALEHLARLCSASTLVADRVAGAPLLLDELLDSRIFTEPPERAAFEAELAQMLHGIAPDDLERQMDTLRTFQQAAVLRIAVADLTGLIPLMKVSDRLTELAEIVLGSALRLAWDQLVAKHGRPLRGAAGPRRERGFSVVAYGKLGGWELAYGSDLDLVFLHDADDGVGQTEGERPINNTVFFARLGQRVVHLLATPTAAGKLYEVDTRLRPSGSSGLLVSSLAAFASYQRNDAWTWEHQALLRARPVAGSAEIGAEFRAVRHEVLSRPRELVGLRADVATMRARMRDELRWTRPGVFDIKQERGGTADIEFLVQFLVLANAHAHPALLEWSDNIRQLDGLVATGILDAATGERLADAYRALRERVHRLGLQGLPALAPDDEFVAERAFVIALWQQYLEV